MPRPHTAPAGAVVVITHAETVKESQGVVEGGEGMCYMANASQTNGRRFVRGSLWIVDDSPPYITPLPLPPLIHGIQ